MPIVDRIGVGKINLKACYTERAITDVLGRAEIITDLVIFKRADV